MKEARREEEAAKREEEARKEVCKQKRDSRSPAGAFR